jgi:hypothetical protein
MFSLASPITLLGSLVFLDDEAWGKHNSAVWTAKCPASYGRLGDESTLLSRFADTDCRTAARGDDCSRELQRSSLETPASRSRTPCMTELQALKPESRFWHGLRTVPLARDHERRGRFLQFVVCVG